MGLDIYKQRDLSHQACGWKASLHPYVAGHIQQDQVPSLGHSLEHTCSDRDWQHSCPKNVLHIHCRQQFSQQPTQLRWGRGHSPTCSSTHSSQVPTHRPGWCSASESLRPFLTLLWQILLLTIAWASVKSDSNKDNEGRCLRSKQSGLHPHCEGSVSFHGAMRTGAISTDFCILYVPHYPRALFYFLFWNLTLCDAPAFAFPALAQSI